MTTIPPNNTSTLPRCLVCNSIDLSRVDGFADLPRITSDCRAFPAGGELFVCVECSTVQKQPSVTWRREIGEIYARYASYYQSGGDEQIVFDRVSGRARRRSDVLMERLAASKALPTKGVALDVGCGNGVTLASMSAVFSGWVLNGYELGDGTLPQLTRLPRFERLYTSSLSAIDREFDLVTMIHSLEHFPSPRKALEALRNMVGGGHLFIEVCDVEQNPFDILVADHVIHFSRTSLCRLLRSAGFSETSATTEWVPKEISLLSRRVVTDAAIGQFVSPPGSEVLERIAVYVNWLRALTVLGRQLAAGGKPMGVFGTSIAATWLASQLEASIAFFVDEDESRIGKMHFGKPIVRPADVPSGSVVYLALPPAIAELIARKLAALPIELVLPPGLGRPGSAVIMELNRVMERGAARP